MIKAVLLDLDGTLLNRDASVQHFIGNQYERLIRPISNIAKETYCTRFIELDGKGYVWKDKVYQQLTQECKIDDISWQALLEDYIEEFHKSCVPFPNLLIMLEMLKNESVKLGIITNGIGKFQMDNMKSLGIERYVDCILVSEWEGIKKPNPAIFQKALAKLNVSPHEAIYVGDHPENDVIGAKNVGMVGVWKKDEAWTSEDADFVVEDLGEIPSILQRLNRTGE
ncbi:HAD-IA family hydrolase [Ornithinibacillus sp. FSL M8-0202]|uniref:HAD family hydrolase n=1 Tax=Ornithinibacillus sp. FSL M8-0202 TaxID=2921616 RepID=UPI0030CDDD1B